MMKWFLNLKISIKLVSGFVVVALIAGLVGVVGIINLRNIGEVDSLLFDENTEGLHHVGNAAIYFQRQRFYSNRMFLVEGSEREQCIVYIEEYFEENEALLNLYKESIRSETDEELFDNLTVLRMEFRSLMDEVLEYARAGEDERAQEIIFSQVSLIDNLERAYENIFDYNYNTGRERAESNAKLVRTATVIMLIVIIIAMLVSVTLGTLAAGSISRPINRMVAAADSLAIGDANVHIEADTKDEVGKLADSFHRMIDNIREQALVAEQIAAGDLTVEVPIRSDRDLLGNKLAELVKNNNEVLAGIASASDQVAVGSKQVSDSSIILSQGATEQASSIEELTASLEEISSQTKLNADNASEANKRADGAREEAARGNTHMSEMLKAMDEINESADNISKIIKVIDDIAFQTNILALNAAVEAARAGQHGKGFAVVAEEVRNLAARSADAAKETTDMIEGAIKKTEDGTKIANETAGALGKIVDEVERVALIINDIANASNEQATGINQINQGIMQISDVVQNNSATSEESAAASEELSGQASLLKEMVSRYKLKGNTKTYDDREDINPEVLRMIENMSDSNKTRKTPISQNYAKKSNRTINLSDNEFGKY